MAGFGEKKQDKNTRKAKYSGRLPSEKDHTDEALRAYQKGDLLRAKHILDRAIIIFPRSSFALGFLATIEKALGFKKRALILFEKSALIDQSHPDILNNYSGLLADVNLGKALEISNRAIDIDPNNSAYLERNGYLKWKSGDLLGALETSIKAIEMNPNLVDAHINISGIQKELGNLDQALTSTLKSLELKPDNPTAHMNLGGIYKELGNLDQALTSTLKSLELKPDNPTAHMILGGIYKDLGNHDQALTFTLKSLELKPDNPDAHMKLGAIYQDHGKLEKALASTIKSLELKPDNPDAHMNLGAIYQDKGNLDKALASTVKSLELKPDNPDALKNLGGIYKGLGKLDQALASTLKSLELKPDNPVAHMNLGSIYKDMGNLDQALASTLKSLELKPDAPDSHLNLGNIYDELKNSEQASASYAKAYELMPNIRNICRAKLFFPWTLNDQDDVEKLRTTYIRNAKKIFKDYPQEQKQFLDLSLFTLAYQNGKDDRNFLELISKLVRPYLQVESDEDSRGISDKHCIEEAPKQSTHPRVGFYFDNIERTHVVYRHYLNFVKCCHSNGIEVVIIKGPNAAKQTSRNLESKCWQSIQLYSNLETSVRALRNLNLNMLIYTEIFSTSVPYCLAHSRIAPIQVVLPGNLITTGISTIDYFISSEYMETSSSASLYSERLIKLTGMPHGITEIPKINNRKNRDYFDLPEKSRVFGLLHNLIKFHPDWDKILERIANENEEAIFILTGKDSIQSMQLKNRWKENAPNFLSKCRFYRRLQQDDYFNLLACSDIVLDPLHMGCGTTSIDALSLGIPIITKPEENPRTRIAYGLYKIMGVKNAPIAYTDLDYVELSNVLLRSSHYYSGLKLSIMSNYHKVITASQQSMHDLVSKIKILSNPLCKP